MFDPQWAPPVPPPAATRRHATGWLLSLFLHGAAVAVLICLGQWIAAHPSGGGGGGGGGQGSGHGVTVVDLSGLGSGMTGQDGAPPAAAEDASAAAAISPETLPPNHPETPPPAKKTEETPVFQHAQPILAPSPKKHAARPKSVSRTPAPRPSRPAARPAESASPAPQPGTSAAVGPGGGASGGTPGHGEGTPGNGPGQGSGTGGGVGKGNGAGLGQGPGDGAADGMRLADVDKKPRIARQVEPEYPEAARRQGIEGRVVARLLITAEGTVARLAIVSAQPPQIFDAAVVAALKNWRFHPAQCKGRDVATWVMLPIRFDLKR